MMKCLFALLGLLLVCNAAHAADDRANDAAKTCYVDATQGDDARDGLTPATSWRSLPRVNKAALQPGARVLFRRGQVWRGQLVPQSGDETGVVTYGAFGEGEKPLLLGSLAKNRAEDWEAVGPNLWATAPLRFQPRELLVDLGASSWSLHHEADAACTMTATPANGQDGKGYRLDCKQPGAQRNHIQLSTSGLRVREGAWYLFSFRARCTKPFQPASLVIMKNGQPWTTYATTVELPPEIGDKAAEFAVAFQATATADDGRLTVFLGGALPAGATLEWQPRSMHRAECNQAAPLAVDVGNIIFDDGRATGVKKWSADALRETGDYFYDGRHARVLLRAPANPATLYRSVELALKRHIINQGGRGYVTYENLALRYGAAHGIGGGSTHHITARDCDISYIGGGHQHTPANGKPVRYGNGIEFWDGARDCLVEGCRIWEIYDAALTNQGSGTNVQENITYRRNVIWNSEYSFEYWNRPEASRTRNIRFEHNTCVNAGYGWGHKQRPDPNGRHLMFYSNTAATEAVVVKYNIFYNATDSLLRLHGRDWTAALTMDHNCWFQPQGPLLLWNQEKIGADEFAAFCRPRGFDVNSKLVDPQFIAPAKNDFRLAPDSPARAIVDQRQPVGALP